MVHLFLKPFLGFLTVGGLVTGSYFLYKHSKSKTETSKVTEGQEDSTGDSSDDSPDSQEEEDEDDVEYCIF